MAAIENEDSTTAREARSFIQNARAAAQSLIHVSEETCNAVLNTLAKSLTANAAAIQSANAKDLLTGEQKGLSTAMLDRLALSETRIAAIADGVRSVLELSAHLNEELSRYESPKGILVRRVRVPLGVICIIYESRPNVSIETAILALKSRNAIILKGGSEAMHSNAALISLVRDSLEQHGCDPNSVQLVGANGREVVNHIIRQEDGVDLVIPRGGEGLIRAVSEAARVPVLKHYKGVCHVFVDSSADVEAALRICENAKCQRPSVCNAAETFLIHKDVASELLPKLGEKLHDRGVEIRGDANTLQLVPKAKPAHEEDWSEEYLDLIVSIKIVQDIDEAISHINRYGSHHTDAILSREAKNLDRFTQEVDSGSIMRNTTTRFSDGFEYGLGAELGISTDKVHARGPMGLEGLTTYKWIVESDGVIRE
ncbi:MAG: glutamate-5-semialdehyde dehydrogenase [Bdellovibrionales bacterium]|nr:glutamate-5-semialdehyde dehydrogenase [Bdellovibrionales bacterium]